MAHDIQHLERKIRALGDVIAKTAEHKHDEQLLTYIHRPGWTTLIENELVNAQLDALHNHATALDAGLESLVKIADKIGRSELNPQPLPP
jgi:hypothetical protein